MENGRLVDLTGDAGLFRLLLDDTRAWRQRLVESFVLESPRHLLVTSEYQIEIPSALIGEVTEGA